MTRYYDLWVNPSNNLENKTLAHLRFHSLGNGWLYVKGENFSGFNLMLESSQHRNFETLMENVMLPLRAFWEAYEKHLTAVEASRLQFREGVEEVIAKARGETPAPTGDR